ncbi:MAG: PHP domain-containing protein [Lachnospiraceae bacterium]|jgi:hypothetical protein|nr:PHP domain-containing protein [Lachnospiraceae bacterium]
MQEYSYEIHLHTKETSRCGHIAAADITKMYHDLGYSGIAVTDHLHETYISSLDCKDNWESCVSEYLKGYKAAKAEGEKLGLDVILGLEIRFEPSLNDYLIYGVDEEFLLNNPYLYRSTIKDFYEKYTDRLLIIQAHPFRDLNETVSANYLHGVEIVNANPRHDSHDEMAFSLAKEMPSLLRTCSSDTHRIGEEGRAAVIFPKRIADSYDLKSAIESRNYKLKSIVHPEIIKESGLGAL